MCAIQSHAERAAWAIVANVWISLISISLYFRPAISTLIVHQERMKLPAVIQILVTILAVGWSGQLLYTAGRCLKQLLRLSNRTVQHQERTTRPITPCLILTCGFIRDMEVGKIIQVSLVALKINPSISKYYINS